MSDTTELSVCDYESDSDLMDDLQSRRQLLGQISELQNAVDDMKSAFTLAIQRLSQVPQEDQSLWNKVEENRVDFQTQVSEVLKLMLTMKADFAALKTQVQQSNEVQQTLKKQIQNLIWERNSLIEELHKSGSVSDQMWYHFNRNLRPIGRASSGSHSNDSGVVLLQSMYHHAHNPFQVPSDQESSMSMLDNPLMVSNAMVRDYVARHSQTQTTPPYVDGEVQVLSAYDSDSSLVNAANKSLTLSTSLGKQCGLELDQCEFGVDRAGDSEFDEDEDCDVGQMRKSKRSWGPRNAVSEMLEEGVKNSLIDGPNENVRLHLAREILESEKNYCGMLYTLLRTFAEPLIKAGIISIKDVNTLFPDEINQLYDKHCALCRTLDDKVQSWARNSTLGDVFDKFTDPLETNVLQLYTSYIDDFPEVLKTFHKLCRKSTKFTQFLKGCLSRPACGGLDLGVFLVAPVQRIPQYILLFKRLLRAVDCGHPDNVLINSCLHRLKDSLNRLNDTMEHSFQLIAAQIQQEDLDCLAMSGWPIKAENLGMDLTRRRLSNVSISNEASTKRSFVPADYSSKKKVYGRGCRTSSKLKEKTEQLYRENPERTPDDLAGVNSKSPLECQSRESLQSQLKCSNEVGKCGETMKSQQIIQNSAPESENLNVDSQCENDGQLKPVKSKPPVKPCRYRGPIKTSSDIKFVESTEKAFVKSDISNFRSNADNVTSSEPNLALDQQVLEMPLDSQSRVTPYKNIEKGGSLGCILTPTTVADDRSRPLGKSESSYTIHHVTVPGATSIPTSQSIPVIIQTPSSSGTVVNQPQIKQKTVKAKTKDKKLVSIRASLKSILTFRKRGSDAVFPSGSKAPEINSVVAPTSKVLEAAAVAAGSSSSYSSSEVQNQICIVLRRDDDVDESLAYECCQSGNSCCDGSHTCSTV